jgi:carboxylesterase type B
MEVSFFKTFRGLDPTKSKHISDVSCRASANRYRYQGVFPNQEITPKTGAYHSSEIPLLFATSDDTGKDTVQEAKLAKNMQHAWAEFAKDPENGLVKLGWPVYEQNGKSIADAEEHYSSKDNFRLVCRVDCDADG